MTSENYKKVLKLAKKAYQSSLYNGENPYLAALDDMVNRDEIVSEVYLGLTEIPIKKIVGTKTHSRSTAFAKNFMPLLGEETEFAMKWDALCRIHETEGIRDPIKVYEYLNRFYVLEGNKRASVLKYHEAVSVPAVVTRLIPKRDEESIQNRLYYEFLHFYDLTKINFIWFTREGNFDELIKIVGEDEKWDDDLRMEFKQLYNRFRRLYKQSGGEGLKITTGDAFLEYLIIYGYKKANSAYDDEISKRVKSMMPELLLLANKKQIDVLTQPVEVVQKKSILSSLTNIGSRRTKKVKVAFVYAKSISESGWTFGHELGRNHIEEVFQDQIETTYIENVPEGNDAYKHIARLAKEGYDVIFTTTPTMINPTLKAAMEYPNVKFLNCSENVSYRHLRTYYGRIYEARFLTGIIAGSMTESNVLGYVANYPISGVISGINAFALGAKLVNPKIKVKLVWSKMVESHDPQKAIDEILLDANVDIVSSQESVMASGADKAFGIYSINDCDAEDEGCNTRNYIATPLWHWGKFYEKIVKNILDGTFNAVNNALGSGTKAINYWWGLNADVVDILYSKSLVPDETKKLIEFMKRMISIGEYHPFTGPIKDQQGQIMVEQDETLNNTAILNMNWLVEHVEGYIPTSEEEELDVPIVDMLGVKKK